MAWIERHLRGALPTTIPYTDPLRAGRHPFQTFMLGLCVISGVPLFAGHETAGSIEATLPDWLAVAWGVALFGGALIAMLGTYWRGEVDTALMLERMGLDLTGIAAVCYTSAIVIVAGVPGLVAAAIVLGFATACLRRARDVAAMFSRAKNGGQS